MKKKEIRRQNHNQKAPAKINEVFNYLLEEN